MFKRLRLISRLGRSSFRGKTFLRTVVYVVAASALLGSNLFAQVDANTLLLLRFENNVNGEQGEAPATATGHGFVGGVQGQGVSLPAGNQLFYPAAGNISSQEGTIEFWIKPNWNGNDNVTHTLLDWGGSFVGGMRIDKHGLNRLSLTFDTFAGWRQVEVDVSSWTAGEWHHLAFTFSNTTRTLQIYIDGQKRAQNSFNGSLPSIPLTNFQIGGAGGSNPLASVIDELRISDRVRTSQEIESSHLSPLVISGLSLSTVTQNLWTTWRIPVTVSAKTNIGTVNISPTVLSWTSSDPSVASVNSAGQIVGGQAGSTTLTGTLNGAQASAMIAVNAPLLPPKIEVPTGFRSVPAANHLYEIPVVSLRYLPTSDGINLDTAWCPGHFGLDPISLVTLEQNLNSYDEIRKYMLEEGSRFRGYGSQAPAPSLGYRVVATITVYEPTPPGKVLETQQNFPIYGSEMIQVFERLGLQNYVENLGVKDVWFWTGQLGPNMASYNPAIHTPDRFRTNWESNMASPTTTDVSNSNRDNTDVPIYNRTYVLYFQTFRRLDTLTLHIDGHQLEAILRHVDWLRVGNSELFDQKFIGRTATGAWQRGRAGDTHFPPNALTDYDYNNFSPFNSDITDWRPAGGGQLIPYSAATVRDTPYIFPNNYLPAPRIEPHWYIFWRQSMPGLGNTIPYDTSSAPSAFARRSDESTASDICVLDGNGFKHAHAESAAHLSRRQHSETDSSAAHEAVVSNRMTNWWHFTGDWDRAISAGVGLYEPVGCSYSLSSSSQTFPQSGGIGQVTVTAPSGCKWFASNNANWTPLVSGGLGNGTGTVNFSVAPNVSASGRSAKIVVAGQIVMVTQAGAVTRRSPFDFDGDSKSDVSIFRPGAGEWWYLKSSDGGNAAAQFGSSTDTIVPADYTGDGKTDIAFWRSSTGEWYVLRSENGTFYSAPFGTNGDIPVPADYDGDGKTDLAVFRPSDATWYIQRTADNGTTISTFGATGDKPVPSDYDGDGKADIAIYRPSVGQWWLSRSTLGVIAAAFGGSLDQTVAGDYTGDGKADIAFYRPSTNEWYVLRSDDFSYYSFAYGSTGDVASPGDYDGDGKTDAAVFRPSTNTWFTFMSSTSGTVITPFGSAGDKAVPNAYVR